MTKCHFRQSAVNQWCSPAPPPGAIFALMDLVLLWLLMWTLFILRTSGLHVKIPGLKDCRRFRSDPPNELDKHCKKRDPHGVCRQPGQCKRRRIVWHPLVESPSKDTVPPAIWSHCYWGLLVTNLVVAGAERPQIERCSREGLALTYCHVIATLLNLRSFLHRWSGMNRIAKFKCGLRELLVLSSTKKQ